MEKLRDEIMTFFQNYTNEIAMVVGAFVVIFIIVYPFVRKWWNENGEWLTFAPRRRGRRMRKQRRDHVRNDAADGFTDFIEMRVYHEQWSRAEAAEIYADLKRLFPVRNLFPSPELLKEKIKARRASGVNAPVDLPGKKPKPKHAFDKS